jgi:hypothetical protein
MQRLGRLHIWLLLVSVIGFSCKGLAFSLLGPRQGWMDPQKGFTDGDVGGPMNINEGYRWNIPVITYGFDRSFLEYFGSNGVAAVEQAIGILNQLPPSSQINLTNYSFGWQRGNQVATAESLVDLKTETLSRLLEQMGLADSRRFTFCIRDIIFDDYTNWAWAIIERNFDPVTKQPSHYVNGALLSYFIQQWRTGPTPTNLFSQIVPLEVDPAAGGGYGVTALDDGVLDPRGLYSRNLSRDDVGGLKFLLSANQVRTEALPSDVHLVGTNAGTLVQVADRPGIEKVTFVRHPAGTLNAEYHPFTNRWTDVYFDYDFPDFQQVERVTLKPDILFSARDLDFQEVDRTGTTNWINHADLNGNPAGAGPGVIQPPVVISFNANAPLFVNYSFTVTNAFSDEMTASLLLVWGSFDDTTNLPIVYPFSATAFQPTKVKLQLELAGGVRDIEWRVVGPPKGQFLLQTSTNLLSWITLSTLTNSGVDYPFQFQTSADDASRFFRTIPKL